MRNVHSQSIRTPVISYSTSEYFEWNLFIGLMVTMAERTRST